MLDRAYSDNTIKEDPLVSYLKVAYINSDEQIKLAGDYVYQT